MGSSTSTMAKAPSSTASINTTPISEKSADDFHRQDQMRSSSAAADLLASLSLNSSGRKPSATADMTLSKINEWDAAFVSNPKHRLASTVLSKNDFTQALTSRSAAIKDLMVFNTKLSSEGNPVVNQKSSGRCWLFATTNVVRIAMMRKYNVEEFQLSQSYLFFYDCLSKSNYFLENMIDLVDLPIDDRLINYLMQAPQNDGGQWDMAVNLVETFGLVPQCVYPESFNSSASSKLDSLLTSKLREYALILRSLRASIMKSSRVQNLTQVEKDEIAVAGMRKKKEVFMEEVYRILAITLGTPPKPDEEITWEYYSKDKKYHSIKTTPLGLYHKYSTVDVSKAISLINDPRNDYNKLYTVERLGNVWGGRPVLYVNSEVQALKDVAIKLLQHDIPVWFGCDVGKSSSTALGIMDTALYNLDEAFSTTLGMTKAERLSTGESEMTHAMTLTAVHIDPETGLSTRWRVENSWGDQACDKGYMIMSDDWFSEHVFQIVADRKWVPKELVDLFEKSEPVVLPAWDPMGSLA